MKRTMRGRKALLVLDDVDQIEQLEALAGDPRWFKPGSRILITTRDEQVLVAHGVKVIRDVPLLSEQEAICLFSRYAFPTENRVEEYKELCGKFVRYAAGLPLTIKVLGSNLRGLDMENWENVIKRLEYIPVKETMEMLELSYMSLEDDLKEIFLDIACILKGETKDDAIRILECCGFYGIHGLKVLEQRSLITVDEYGCLGMFDHIEEMGKNIVRRLHHDKPNKHSRLWIKEEIEDVLANDMGTGKTRCLKLTTSRRNSKFVMKGLVKMKKLRYLEVNYADNDGKCIGSDLEKKFTSQLDESTQYFPNCLRYLRFGNYPFLYLPKTFEANNLVGLEMNGSSRMVQLWEEGEKKVLRKLKFLSLTESKLTTFYFSITPNIETLSLKRSYDLVELCMPVICQKLKHLVISESKLRTFDLGLTSNLETLSFDNCVDFKELYMSVTCPNLKSLNLCYSRLRSLDLELIPNLENLVLKYSKELVEINAPVRSLKKVVECDLHGCALLEKLPEDLGRSGCLRKLNILETGISYLPESIFGLKGLYIAASSEVLQLYNFPSMPLSSNSSAPKKENSSSNSFESETEKSSSNSSEPKVMVSTLKRYKYDVFISLLGEDAHENFVNQLYQALTQKGMYTYKDDEKIHKGERIGDELINAIEDSKFYIIVFSKKYVSSSWCLEELVKIMECQKMTDHTAYPIFYDVEPSEVRKLSGAVGEAFSKHEKEEDMQKWSNALKGAADLAGWVLKNTLDGHEVKFINKFVQKISLELSSINFSFNEKLVGMESRVKDIVSNLEVGVDDVRMIGIKGMGGIGKTTLAMAVFDYLSNHFEAKSFVENVREVSMFGLRKLQEQLLSNLLNEHVILGSVYDGKNMMRRYMCRKKVLLVIDDVDHPDQLEALAGDRNWFKPGSRIIFTTRDERLLVAQGVNLIRDVAFLSAEEAICLFSRFAFGRENPIRGYEELSEQCVRYAAGLPLTIKDLGSFLCHKDMDVWEDVIKRLKVLPWKATQKKLESSYFSLEYEYREIFLDIACILKGQTKEDAIRILECCGLHAIHGLKVLEQRSLITISPKYGEYGEVVLGMHDHIEEMGKNFVRRSHPDEPNKHSHLWIKEEIEDVLANDMGTEETKCLKLTTSRRKAKFIMKGLGKMRKLRYLEVNYTDNDGECIGSDPNWMEKLFTSQLDESTRYFPNSLRYLRCWNYPFLYLPKTFEANNLVGLEMNGSSRMVQLWEQGEKKLKHLVISESKLRTFDLGLTPNLETLSLDNCADFEELYMPVTCPNLKSLNLCYSRLRSLNLELIPNLENLDLKYSEELVEMNAPVGSLEKVVKFDLHGCALLEKLPEDVGRLGCLKKLNILETGISHLPKSIFGLKGLYIAASSELLRLYDFPSEIETTTSYAEWLDKDRVGSS